MVRQKSRKTAEELYATAPPPPPLGTTRFEENFFQNSKSCKNHKIADNNIGGICRKKTKGPTTITGGAEKKDEKTFINEGRFLGKGGKGGRSKKSDLFESSSLDNKHMPSFVGESSEKDEDTEEFLDLIKETVENAVGKTLSDILNRNFREVSGKIDDLREQMQAQETKLEKIQSELNNKIAHYGEENSRHFRYLCMKSEYDKMFYQHQNVMNGIPVESRPNVINPYPQQFATAGPQVAPQSQTATAAASQCNCHHSQAGGDFNGVAARSKTNMSTKSSELGIKDIKGLLEQLQRFYESQQANEKGGRKNSRGNISLPERDDSAEGDDDDSSDDNMSAESIEEKLGDCGDC